MDLGRRSGRRTDAYPTQCAVRVVVLAVWVVFRVGWKKMLLFVVVAGLVVTPWVIRNWVQIGTPTITTSNGFNLGRHLWSAGSAAGRVR